MKKTITENGVEYISAKDASLATGYARDYISRLCRQQKVSGSLVEKNWYVDLGSLEMFSKNAEIAAEARREELRRRARIAIERVPSTTNNDNENSPIVRSFIASLNAQTENGERRPSEQIGVKSSAHVSEASLWRETGGRLVALMLAFAFAYGILAAANPAAAVYTYHEVRNGGEMVIQIARHDVSNAIAALDADQTIQAQTNPISLTAATAFAADFTRHFREISSDSVSQFLHNTAQWITEIHTVVASVLEETIASLHRQSGKNMRISPSSEPSASHYTQSQTPPLRGIALDYSFLLEDQPEITRLGRAPQIDDFAKRQSSSSDTNAARASLTASAAASKAHEITRSAPDDQLNTSSAVTPDHYVGITHQEILCIGTEGDETCIAKTQFDALLANLTSSPPLSETASRTPGDSISFARPTSEAKGTTN